MVPVATLDRSGGEKVVIGELLNCARSECGNPFNKVTHNQKYCSNLCCRIETNRKMMQKYHERVAIRKGKARSCIKCGTSLSRYNQNETCGPCHEAKRKEHVGEAARLVAGVSWL